MSHEIDRSKLSFMIFPTRFPHPSYLREYQKAYECWHSIWNQALKEEMNVKEHLYSDNFTKQSHVAVIFYKEVPACLVTLNYFDLNDPVVMNDSYFKVWPEIASAKIKKEASNIMVCGNLSLCSDFRRNALGVSWKDLMFAFVVRHLKSSLFDSVVATVRLEKGMEKSAYRTGAHPIQRDLPYSIPGQRIDIVSWDRTLDETIIDKEIWSLVNFVWNNSSIIIETPSTIQKQGEKYVA